MPKGGKVFLISTTEELEDLKNKLEGWSATDKYVDGDFTIDLLEDVSDLSIASVGSLQLFGVYSYDYVMRNTHRGRVVHTPITQTCPFNFGKVDGKLWLLVLAKKNIADRAAVKLGEICNIDVRTASIYSREMNHYLKLNDKTKVVLFSDLDIPGVKGSTLYGDELVQTSLFRELVGRGIPKWVVTESDIKGYTVGISGDGSVIIFNTVTNTDYVGFIEDEILPLIFRKVKASEQQTL